MDAMIPSLSPSALHSPATAHRPVPLQQVARDFEASFLAEMLRAARFGDPGSAPEGGIGEAQFASFLVEAQARQLAARGGLGLAEMILSGLMARADAASTDHE